jgi:hypothetical protein
MHWYCSSLNPPSPEMLMAALVQIAAPNDNMEHIYMFTITFDHKGMNVTSQPPPRFLDLFQYIHVYSNFHEIIYIPIFV